ncbi:phosphoglycerate mutase [Lentilactobacillus buchneri DSM 20057]|nr:phosphoglycerate mutase [Lentilactobacillus buchneri DSM 20057]
MIDSPLTDKGIADAVAAGKRLSQIKFDAAYSSDTSRAIKTGQLILKENPAAIKDPVPTGAFRELNFGYYEGEDDVKTWHTIGGPIGINSFHGLIAEFGIEKAEDMIAAADPYKDAESGGTFWKRLKLAIDQVVADAQDGDKILLATHGTLIRNVVAKFSDIPVDVSTKNGSVTKVNWDGKSYSVEYFNNVSEDL